MAYKFKDIVDSNNKWAKEVTDKDPNFFSDLAKGQDPDFLWIGCSDSRVPPNQVTGSMPGAIFVHRNIANMVIATDSSLLSVVHYAVVHLKVKRIVVCGHYGCGGVQAAMQEKSYGYLDGWLGTIKDVYKLHYEELKAISDEQARFDRLVELNVQKQVENLSHLSVIQERWKDGEYPIISGFVYALEDGTLSEVAERISGDSDIESAFSYDF